MIDPGASMSQSRDRQEVSTVVGCFLARHGFATGLAAVDLLEIPGWGDPEPKAATCPAYPSEVSYEADSTARIYERVCIDGRWIHGWPGLHSQHGHAEPE
jgi:hypothetical protein